jgi:signal peptidase
MSPTLESGDLIFLERVHPEEVGIGDIVAFKPQIVTVADILVHRIQSIEYSESGRLFYTTKGDANQLEDSFKVPFDNVEGRLLFTIPYLGNIILILTNPFVLILIIVITLRKFI